eukprot:TRINITY_DN2918_c1_g1_i1.p1 TRINITY_DN2918_c1_g1~~TRINITY_DN2918_c1_g1_i1.p1  ORF type:complete len:752 (+),score=114.19 TRINITY_DN2918_c1_g1_i1:87-2342(+)
MVQPPSFVTTPRLADGTPLLRAVGAVVTPKIDGNNDLASEFEGFRREGSGGYTNDYICVCFPMYNEDDTEVKTTLFDLAKCQQKCDQELKVCIIQDGWKHIHPSAKQMFVDIYKKAGAGQAESWIGEVDELFAQYQADTASGKRTVIFPQRKVDVSSFGRGQTQALSLHITLILKVDNRKKHNSHDLFFRGFAAAHKTKYVFATDCGTLFDPDCLRGLTDMLDAEADCIAVSGRQRVMTKWQQAGCETEGLFEGFLRAVQGYDYEASTVIFNGCFSLFGCLPVIPGPCGLFRLEPLLTPAESGGESPFEFYATAAQRAEEEQAMLAGNTLLAEDRVLTFAACFKAKTEGTGEPKIRWNKRSVFYFAAETGLKGLVSQRRRWLNGTVAAYIFVVNQMGGLFGPESKLSCKAAIRLRFIQFLNYFMLAIYAGIALGPGVYAYLTATAMRYLLNAQTEDSHRIFTLAIGVIMYATYAAFQWRHHFVPYCPIAFTGATLVNGAAALVVVSGLAVSLVSSIKHGQHNWLQYAGVFYLLMPIFLNAMIPDLRALCVLINPVNFVAYLTFMPTMQGYFLSLAIARTFDLSWGNRAGIGAESDNLKADSKALIIGQNVVNAVLMGLTFHFNSTLTFPMEIFLTVVLMTPTVLISCFSMIQALGIPACLITIILEAAAIGLCKFHDKFTKHLPEHVQYQINYYLQHVVYAFPVSLMTLTVVMVLVFKLIGLKFCQRSKARQARETPAASVGLIEGRGCEA